MVQSKKINLVFLIVVTLVTGTLSQTNVLKVTEIPGNFCVSEVELKLFRMINEYRRQYDLPPIPLSRSLCYVANTHVRDLFFHQPDKEPCNFHSWSDKGLWKPFCYPGDENKKNSVWDKPKELTGYPSKGFEIVYWENDSVVIDSVISFWRAFDYFNSFLMNTGKWEGRSWNAIGIGICQNYAAAWFGEVHDPEGAPLICGHSPPEQMAGPVQPLTDDVNKAAVPKTVTDSSAGPAITTGHYYIIVRSQLPEIDAEKEVQKLLARGYSHARVLKSREKVRVSMFDTGDRTEALRYLKEAKGIYPDAWLFRQ